MKNKELPDWVNSTLSDYILDEEDILDWHIEDKTAIIVTNQRLIDIQKQNNKTEFQSKNLTGDHIIGSRTEHDTETSTVAVIGILLMVLSAITFVTGYLASTIALFSFGFVLSIHSNENTKITIKTRQNEKDITHEIPEDAEYLGQTISRQIAKN